VSITFLHLSSTARINIHSLLVRSGRRFLTNESPAFFRFCSGTNLAETNCAKRSQWPGGNSASPDNKTESGYTGSDWKASYSISEVGAYFVVGQK